MGVVGQGLYMKNHIITKGESYKDESTDSHLKDAVDMYRWLAGNLRLWSVEKMLVATAKTDTMKQ